MNLRSFLVVILALSVFFIETACQRPDSDFVSTADPAPAARATNELGLDLYRRLATADENFCLSPYSIETALAVTAAGADGVTREEMAHALHLSKIDDALHDSFEALRRQLQEIPKRSAKWILEKERYIADPRPTEPITLTIASRLFAQKGFELRQSFLALAQQRYGVPLQPLDFAGDAGGATRRINSWISVKTHKRIQDLIPPDALNSNTRLVLANAIYLKAQWDEPVLDWGTEPLPFHIRGGEPVNVPTMTMFSHSYGYARHDDFTVVSIPYVDPNLHFLILLPDDANGLSRLETRITAEVLAAHKKNEERFVVLYLPKFKFESTALSLRSPLEELGMKTAFDLPSGSANFDRMAARKPNDFLHISNIFHKTFIAVDENGTEAAAATVEATLGVGGNDDPLKPIEVKIDRPFFFAIQHGLSGVCLFIGRVTDPR